MNDELTPIAMYMAHEMNANTQSPEARTIAQLNETSNEACVSTYFKSSLWQRLFGTLSPQQCSQMTISAHQAALITWAVKVAPNAEWDHKPKIREKFISPTSHRGDWHAYGEKLYYYDIWSNVHFGYVGRAAKFSEEALLDGAGLAQALDDLVRRRQLPSAHPGFTALRAYDDEQDQNAIMTGMKLYASYPSHLSWPRLLHAVVNSPGAAVEGIK